MTEGLRISSFDRDRDFLRNDWGLERVVLGITKHKLERVLARRQLYARLRLPCAEVEMVLVLLGNVRRPDVSAAIRKSTRLR